VDLILCWFIAPVGLLAAAVGLSLLVERLTRFGLPWTVRPALGMAAMIVIAQFGTATGFTAKLTIPAILILAVLGLLLCRDLARPRPGNAEVGVAAGVFLLFAAPFLISGEATWAGYIKLDDNATWLAITDHVFEHGRGLTEMAPSTHQQVLTDYLEDAYPIGGFVLMAVMSAISGQDIAYTLQPSMAVAAAMMALLLFELARRLVSGVGPAAFVAVVASLSALLLGYYLWGGVKELVMAALLPLGPLLAGSADTAGWPRRAFLGIALTIAAIFAVLGPGGALWAVPPLVPALVVVWRRDGRSRALRLATPVAILSFVLLLPVIFTPTGTFDPLAEGVTGEDEIGNLFGPLSLLQAAGIWPSLDFRTSPELSVPIKILAGATLLAAACVVVYAWRLPRAAGAPLVGYVAGGALGAAGIVYFGSTWVDAKVLATISPGLLAAALIGTVLVAQRTDYRLEAAAAAALVAAMVAWGAILAYQGTWLAPREPHLELSEVGERFAGAGPTLINEVSGYGPRYFLRDLDPEGASDRRRRPVLLRDGNVPEDGQYVNLDDIRPDQLAPYNLLVTRRSPAESRPPAEFGLAYSGDYYDVWQRRESPGALIEHLPLGTDLDAGSIPPCAEVERLAEAAGEEGTLVAARVGTPIALEVEGASMPAGWETPTTYTFSPDGSGRLSTVGTVPGGEYEVWLGGEVFGAVDLYLDGEKVASQRGVLNNSGALDHVATVELGDGEHRFELDYSGAGGYPGSALDPYSVGPLELRAPQGSDLGLTTVTPERYRELCDRRWDWVAAYGP
jgi:hypothetical protein